MSANIIVAGCLGLAFLVLYWVRARRTTNALVIRSPRLRLLLYGLVFIVGEAYLIALFADMEWPRVFLFLAIASWGVLVSPGPWNRRRA